MSHKVANKFGETPINNRIVKTDDKGDLFNSKILEEISIDLYRFSSDIDGNGMTWGIWSPSSVFNEVFFYAENTDFVLGAFNSPKIRMQQDIIINYEDIRCLPTRTNSVSGGLNIQVDSSGNYGIATSASRFKENVQNITEESMSILDKVSVKQYTKVGTNEKEYGMIAEEVNESIGDIAPHIIAWTPETPEYWKKDNKIVYKEPEDLTGWEYVPSGEKEILTIRYEQFIPLLVKKVQDLQNKIDSLENK